MFSLLSIPSIVRCHLTLPIQTILCDSTWWKFDETLNNTSSTIMH